MAKHRPHLSSWAIAGAGLAMVATAMRFNNALRYPHLLGFDAVHNWRYIARLEKSWVLPAPDAGWSTAHPPFFYYMGGAIARALDFSDESTQVIVIRLACSLAGLAMGWLAFILVRRIDPADRWRAWMAAALVLLLPAHVYMSAMLGEEVLASFFSTLALIVVGFHLAGREPLGERLGWAVWAGIFGGLATLTKLSGALVVVAVTSTLALEGLRRREWRGGLKCAVVVGATALVVGGWYYGRNLVQYGYLYPHGLAQHRIMLTMPPGERHLADYLRFPIATFTESRVGREWLLDSVWGGTYTGFYYDGHRKFLPKMNPAVDRMGTLILVLALLPTSAFVVGLFRGGRRAIRDQSGLDLLLVSMVGVTLAGYVLFTWRNPWYATVKGSYLLGMSLPFTYYASEVLSAWGRRSRVSGRIVWGLLLALWTAIAATFTIGVLFVKVNWPGL